MIFTSDLQRFMSHWGKKRVVTSLANLQHRYSSLVLARHPLERLFSAFRDKILRKRLETKVLLKLKYYNNICSIIVKNINGGRKKPTFSKFLTFLAMNNPTSYNRHWKPNWVLCNPCKYHYDYIVKASN